MLNSNACTRQPSSIITPPQVIFFIIQKIMRTLQYKTMLEI
jgi:hypothetical protein